MKINYLTFGLLLRTTAVWADSSGTGFFVSPAGYLVTNFHVVKDSTQLTVKFGTTVAAAKVVTVDKINDIALLKLTTADTPPAYLEVNENSVPVPGADVFTVGFPDPGVLGVTPKTTRGYISSTAGLADDPRFLQISVPIQPGNSGGPLVDFSGQVIGITTATLNASSRLQDAGYLPQNVNYALKASYLRGVFDQVRDRVLSATASAPPALSFAEVQNRTEQAVALIIASSAPVTAASASPVCDVCPAMVTIPAGEFMMGSDDSDPDALPDEKPPHRVQVKAFALGQYEVTQGQWRQVMGSNPSNFQACGDTCPVEQVSWNEVQTYITQLNAQTGRHYRLPTEAEWEYACRAGQNQRYCGADQPDPVAWYDKNASNTTHPVGQKQANAWGLYDMSGNVNEWTCSAAYSEAYNGSEQRCAATTAPRVIRGGSWRGNGQYVRSAVRGRNTPVNRFFSLGFRLALGQTSP